MRFAVVSLNVWALPRPISRDRLARMEAIGKRLPDLDADAFAFQEVWTEDARTHLVEAGRRSGHAHVWHPREFRGTGGLLVLSRHPIRAAEFTRFALGGLPERVHHGEYFSGKGILRVTLETPVGALCLAVTHLTASYGRHGAEDDYRGHRCAQMIESAWALRNVELPVVLAGDLNAHETDPELRVLRGLAGLTDVAAALDNRQETVLPFSPYRPNENPPGPRIDYVLSRGGRHLGLRQRSIQRVLDEEFEVEGHVATYSNHTGLRAEFETNEDGTTLPAPAATTVALARELLSEGRERARTRRTEQRVLAGGAGLSALALLSTAHRGEATRRRALRAGLYAAGGLALLGAGGLTALSEGFAPKAFDGYDRAESQLAALAGPVAG